MAAIFLSVWFVMGLSQHMMMMWNFQPQMTTPGNAPKFLRLSGIVSSTHIHDAGKCLSRKWVVGAWGVYLFIFVRFKRCFIFERSLFTIMKCIMVLSFMFFPVKFRLIPNGKRVNLNNKLRRLLYSFRLYCEYVLSRHVKVFSERTQKKFIKDGTKHQILTNGV